MNHVNIDQMVILMTFIIRWIKDQQLRQQENVSYKSTIDFSLVSRIAGRRLSLCATFYKNKEKLDLRSSYLRLFEMKESDIVKTGRKMVSLLHSEK